jgi:hypothetical protein
VKVRIEPIPAPLWGQSLSQLLPKSRWRKLRGRALAEGLVCARCGKMEAESKRLNLHEVWRYDTDRSPAVARLTGLELLCKNCHGCEHFGRLASMAEAGHLAPEIIAKVIDHFCRENGLTRADFRRHHAETMAVWDKHNERDWAIDWGEFGDYDLPTGPFRAIPS